MAAGAGSGQGRDSGRKAGQSRALCGSRGTESHKQGHVEEGEAAAAAAVGQEEQLREDAALQGAIPCRIPALAFMALTMKGSWGCQEQLLHSTHTSPAHCQQQWRQSEEVTILTPTDSPLGESLRARGNFPQLFLWHVRPNLPRTGSPRALHSSFNKVLPAATAASRRRAPAGCGTGAMGAIGAPGTAKGAPTQNRSHSAAVCIVCTRQCLTTAFTLSRMEKLPFILLVSNPYVLNHQFTREFSLELRQELFLQQHSWIFSLLLNY